MGFKIPLFAANLCRWNRFDAADNINAFFPHFAGVCRGGLDIQEMAQPTATLANIYQATRDTAECLENYSNFLASESSLSVYADGSGLPVGDLDEARKSSLGDARSSGRGS